MWVPLPWLVGLAILALLVLGAGYLAVRRLRGKGARTAAPLGPDRQARHLQAMLDLCRALPAARDPDEILGKALSTLCEAVQADRAAIELVTQGPNRLVHWASHAPGEGLQPIAKPLVGERNRGLAGWVVEHRQAVLIPDLARDRRWVPYPGSTDINSSAIAVPLGSDKEMLGALLLLSRDKSAFDQQDLDLARAAGGLIAAALTSAGLQRSLHDQSLQTNEATRLHQVEASRAQAILESIADGVLVTGPSHQVTLCNAATERILNLDRKAALGRPAVEFIGLFGAAGRRWADALQAWSQHPPAESEHVSLADRLELEGRRVVAVHVAPVVSGREFLGTASVFRDITREVEVDRLKSEFIATVSHELRTPMTSIRGYVHMLLLEAAGPLTEEQQRFLETIRSNADRLGRLVNELLDTSSLESGARDLALESVDVQAALETARDYLASRCAQDSKGLHISLEVPEGLPPLQADPARLQQILRGLLDNSFSFTPAGGSVALGARKTGHDLEIEISDTGTGISPADQTRIFERFFRGEKALELGVPGSGLGLSIVAHLVELHGGEIRVDSAGVPGKGSTFLITLPLTQEVGVPRRSGD